VQDAWFEELRFSKTQGDPGKFLRTGRSGKNPSGG
jgi:predicted glutamine amidotransferase